MNFLVTLIRFPLGIIAVLIVLFFWLFLFPFEIFFMIIALPFGAIFMSREELKDSWVGKFPNTLKNLINNIKHISIWVKYD